jgi:hypothetical protein
MVLYSYNNYTGSDILRYGICVYPIIGIINIIVQT